MWTVRAIAASMAAAVMLVAQPAKAGVCQNAEYGIALPLPAALRVCEDRHGLVVLLGRSDTGGCEFQQHRRAIYVFAYFNALDATRTLTDFFRSECTGITKESCTPASSKLRVHALACLSGRVDHADGWVEIFVVTQAGKWSNAPEDLSPSVNYSIRLVTTRAHLRRDLRAFREILRDIRLGEPQ